MENSNMFPNREIIKDNKFSYAMAYVPMQQWTDIYELDTALARGTLFPALDKPFIGEEAVPNG